MLGWDNEIGPEGAYQLGQSLSKLTALKNLKIHIDNDNDIQTYGLFGIAIGITKLKELT